MSWYYVGNGAWGTGLGAPLTQAQFDGNTYETQQRIEALEANPAEPVEISNITQSGNQITVHMANGDTYGPFDLPSATATPPDITSSSSTSITPVLADANSAFLLTGTNPTFTVPPASSVAYAAGTKLYLINGAASSTVTIAAGSGVTLVGDAPALTQQWATATLTLLAGDQWLIEVQGDLAVSTVVTNSGTSITPTIGVAQTHIRLTGTNPTFTVPPNSSVAYPVGTEIWLFNAAASSTATIAPGSGVTLNYSADSLLTFGTNAWARLKKVGTDTWDVIGKLNADDGITTVASAATTTLAPAHRRSFSITGTTTITSFGSTMPVGAIVSLSFTGVLQVTHNSTSMILPGATNKTTAAGTTMLARHEGSGNWRVLYSSV